MRGKITQYPLSFVLTSIASVFALVMLLLFVMGVFVGLFVEIVKFNSRKTVPGKQQQSKYKIPVVIVEDKQSEKTAKKGKIFRLPLPESIQDERMAYAREK